MKNYKGAIIAFLESKGNSADIDEFLIDDLIFNMGLLEEARAALSVAGLIENSKWGRKMTPELLVYQMLQKEVKAGWGILGISPRDRLKLKIEAMEKEDSFDEVFR
jgi:phage terminase small subunit